MRCNTLRSEGRREKATNSHLFPSFSCESVSLAPIAKLKKKKSLASCSHEVVYAQVFKTLRMLLLSSMRRKWNGRYFEQKKKTSTDVAFPRKKKREKKKRYQENTYKDRKKKKTRKNNKDGSFPGGALRSTCPWVAVTTSDRRNKGSVLKTKQAEVSHLEKVNGWQTVKVKKTRVEKASCSFLFFFCFPTVWLASERTLSWLDQRTQKVRSTKFGYLFSLVVKLQLLLPLQVEKETPLGRIENN